MVLCSIILADKPIKWDLKNDVKMVVMLVISKEVSESYASIFGDLYDVTKEKRNVDMLVKQKSFADFVGILEQIMGKEEV
jgi:mannitol/fructose-specific phosphotransferase system IIA component (Ntr-type)